MIVDLFAGPGGWSEGLRLLGLGDVGFELDSWACATRVAAGHATVRADVASLTVAQLAGRIEGLIASPPCQGLSAAGLREGVADIGLITELLGWLAAGHDRRAEYAARMADPRSLLLVEPLRYALAARPEWIALEQVPAAQPHRKRCGDLLEGDGYSAWAGVLNAADYGVPQTRTRAILIASRVRRVTRPEATHYDPRKGDQLWGNPWVSMAQALGWGYVQRPAPAVTGGGTETGGAEHFGNGSRQAMHSAMQDEKHWAWKRPGRTVSGTVGHVGSKQSGGGHLNLPPAEAAVLQSFPRGYPFQGNKGQVAQQIGNAVPPLLAAHVVSAACGAPLAAHVAGSAVAA